MTPEEELGETRARIDGLQRMIRSLRDQLGEAAVRNAEVEAMLRQEIDVLRQSRRTAAPADDPPDGG